MYTSIISILSSSLGATVDASKTAVNGLKVAGKAVGSAATTAYDPICTGVKTSASAVGSAYRGVVSSIPDPVKDKTKSFATSKAFIIGTGLAVGSVAAITLAPFAAGVIGFTAVGIQAGSLAASMMSTLGGAATASGSTVAVLQSVGATGSVLGSVAATGTSMVVGSACGAAVSTVFTGDKDKRKP